MKLKVAAIQMDAGNDKRTNIERAVALVRRAIARGAQMIVLPEVFNFRGLLSRPGVLSEIAERIPGESIRPLRELARWHKVFILAGSVYEKVPSSKKVYNSSVLIGDRGELLARYRKRNLFDARIGRKAIKESKYFLAGSRLATAAVKGFSVGLSICYDLRFPPLYQAYAQKGCHILTVPSAFTKKTGEAHWELLLRARAVETQCFVIAPNQTGQDARGVETYGNSMIVGPWGEVLARASAGKTEIIVVDLDMAAIKQARVILPSVKRYKTRS